MSSRILLISGSDSSAGAGHQIDLKTVFEYGHKPCSALTAITVQSDDKAYVSNIISAELVKQQVDVAIANYDIAAVKIGMLGDDRVIDAVVSSLTNLSAPIIVDPVLATSSGTRLLNDSGLAVLRKDLLPLTYCVTPNLIEAEILAGIAIRNNSDLKQAAKILLDMGVRNVLIKGGHSQEQEAKDYLFGERELVFSSQRYKQKLRGSGCILASAIACNIAKGHFLEEAIDQAKQHISELFAEEI